MIEPGTPAPDFTLPDQEGNKVSLEDLKGQTTVLVFYPLDFSPVCSDQLNVYQEVMPDFEEQGIRLVGISVDSAFCHNAFRDRNGLSTLLLADFHPKGEVAKKFGVWSEQHGCSERALFLLDEEGIVRWSYLSPMLDVPGANLIFDAVAEARTA